MTCDEPSWVGASPLAADQRHPSVRWSHPSGDRCHSPELATTVSSAARWRAAWSATVAGRDDVGLDGVVDRVRRVADGHGSFVESARATEAPIAAGAQDD